MRQIVLGTILVHKVLLLLRPSPPPLSLSSARAYSALQIAGLTPLFLPVSAVDGLPDFERVPAADASRCASSTDAPL